MPDGSPLPAGMLDGISTAALFAGVLWGGLAGGFIVYGSKQKVLAPFLVGVALTAATYLLWNSAIWMSVVSVAILAGFFWLKSRGYC